MYLFDVNIFVHMHRNDSEQHEKVFDFALRILRENKAFGYSPLALSGFLRIVTHPKIFKNPIDFETAMSFVESITDHPNAVQVIPGSAHWHIFRHLSYEVKPLGNFYPDVYFAALAIDSGCTWVTCDKGYERFSGLDCKFL